MMKCVLRRSVPFLIAVLFASAGIGCASGSSNLRVTSIGQHQVYQPTFTHAYASRGDDGDLDVVLAGGRAREGEPAVRHLVHVRVLWQPMKGAKLNEPAATNATITWYVFANPDGKGAAMLEYDGAGFVRLDADGEVTKMEIRNATLRPDAHSGTLRDPIGPSRLSGTVVAHNSRSKVNELLAEVSDRLAESRVPRTPTPHSTASTRVPQE